MLSGKIPFNQWLCLNMLCVTPVFEAPWYEEVARWPWPIASASAFTFVPITADTDESVLGSFFAGFAPVLDPPDLRPPDRQLEDIIESGADTRCGGVRFKDGVTTINPGCCGDLRAANEWTQFLVTEEKPWTGHDPAPWASVEGEDILIWSDGGLENKRMEPCIRTSKNVLKRELLLALDALAAFGRLCGQWLLDHNIPRSNEIQARIISDFQRPSLA